MDQAFLAFPEHRFQYMKGFAVPARIAAPSDTTFHGNSSRSYNIWAR
jgi:hypothetical protein